MNKINVIYFSCARDEEMMMNSIISLRKNFNPNKIFIANDLRDPITKFEEGLIYIPKQNSTEKLYGLDNIKEMLRIYKIVSEDSDYIQKIDSDVLICSDYCYKNLEINQYDAYGSFPMAIPEMIPPKHFAGPSYFIKSEIAANLIDSCWPDSINDWAWMNYPEDMCISQLVSQLTQNVFVEGTAMHEGGKYLFDTYLTDIAKTSKNQISEYGFAHCRTNPYVLKFLFDKLYSF